MPLSRQLLVSSGSSLLGSVASVQWMWPPEDIMCRWTVYFCFPHNLVPGRPHTTACLCRYKVLPAAVSLSRRPLDKAFEQGGKRPDSSLRDPGGLRYGPRVCAEARLSGKNRHLAALQTLGTSANVSREGWCFWWPGRSSGCLHRYKARVRGRTSVRWAGI